MSGWGHGSSGLACALVLLAAGLLVWPERARAWTWWSRRAAATAGGSVSGPRSEAAVPRACGARLLASLRGRGPGARRRARELSLLAAIDALAPALDAGLPAGHALREAASVANDPYVRRLVADLALDGEERARAGAPTVATKKAPSDGDVDEGIELLRAAWALADRLGTPLASSARAVGSVVRAELAARRAVAAAVAEARASVAVLMLLPLLGPALAMGIGVSPRELYGGAVGAVCGAGGVLLLVAGQRWMTRLIHRVAQSRVGT